MTHNSIAFALDLPESIVITAPERVGMPYTFSLKVSNDELNLSEDETEQLYEYGEQLQSLISEIIDFGTTLNEEN